MALHTITPLRPQTVDISLRKFPAYQCSVDQVTVAFAHADPAANRTDHLVPPICWVWTAKEPGPAVTTSSAHRQGCTSRSDDDEAFCSVGRLPNTVEHALLKSTSPTQLFDGSQGSRHNVPMILTKYDSGDNNHTRQNSVVVRHRSTSQLSLDQIMGITVGFKVS